jgi:hypothetical protein
MAKAAAAQKAFVANRIGDFAMIGAMGLLYYELAKNGVITGKAPADKDARDFMKTSGILPYSFEIGGKTYTYDWAQPSSIPLATGADIYYQLKNSKKPEQALLEAGASGLNTLFSQSLVQGLSKMFGNNSYNQGGGIAENLTNIALGVPTQFIPLGSISRQATEISDSYQRNLTSDSQIQSRLINPVKNMIPGLRQTLPVKIDTFGNKIPSKSAIDTLFNPANASASSKTGINNELLRLNTQSNEVKQFPQLGKGSIGYKLGRKGDQLKTNLTPQQIESYQESLGKSNFEAIKSAILTPDYLQGNDKQKSDIISNILSKTKQSEETKALKSLNINEYISSGSTRGSRNGRETRSARQGR